MAKQIRLKNLDEFNARIESIAQLRYKAMDQIDELNAQLIEYAKENEVFDANWRSIALEYFHSDKYEKSVEAYLKAIKATKKLGKEEEKYLIGTYGDLAMVYEHMERYSEALNVAELALRIAKDYKSDSQSFLENKVQKLRSKISA